MEQSFRNKGEAFLDKQQLRKQTKEIRSKLDMKSLSKELTLKLKQTIEYQNAHNIMIFYPLEKEVNLLSLLDDNTKNFYLPKIDGNELLCCRFDKKTELCDSCFKTKEPLSDSDNKSILDLIIVPALAADKNNYRLGYGKGFYDRFLNSFKDIRPCTIVCIPKELIVETIFPDEFDIPVNKVIITD